ncbi:MAG: XRE family transcriptional regulator [Lachnospiraceae bacterium]|nr:XRE family transcriptional regulator [Lachnospiraceae bacterium]
MKNIGKVIYQHRKNRKLSQIELSEKLAERHILISNAAISAWEKGNSMPSAAALLAVCEILGISDIYTEFIGTNPSDPFRNLNEEGSKKALDYIDLLEKSGEYHKQKADLIDIRPRLMKVSMIRASAGTGNFLAEENFEEMEITDPVPDKADFGVYIDGDSMEPRFHDEQLVWIERTEALEPGDIGLFYLDGCTYIKKYAVNSTGTFLVSLNAKYAPKEVGEFSSFRIFGRVLPETSKM